jgi:hypothetical protein
MARNTDPQESNQPATIKEYRERANAIAHYVVDSLVRRDWGDITFESLEPDFRMMQDLLRRAVSLDLESVPQQVAAAGLHALADLHTAVSQINDLTLRQLAESRQSPLEAREQAANAFRSAYSAFLVQNAPVFSFALATTVRQQLAGASEALTKTQLRLTTAVEEAEASAVRVTAIAESVSADAQKAGVSRQAVHFEREATKHEKTAKRWLFAVWATAARTIVLAVGNLAIGMWPRWAALTMPINTTAAAQLIVSKVVFFSILVSAVLWCGRMYRSHNHNAVVNRHRQNALSSFLTFVDSTDDPAVRHTVLVQATQAIFAPQHSGFSTTESDPTVAPPIYDAVRAMTSTSRQA